MWASRATDGFPGGVGQAEQPHPGRGQPAPRRAFAQDAGPGPAGVPPAGEDARQPLGPHVQGISEQVNRGAVLVGAQRQAGDVPVGDLDGPGVRAARPAVPVVRAAGMPAVVAGPGRLPVTGTVILRQPPAISGSQFPAAGCGISGRGPERATGVRQQAGRSRDIHCGMFSPGSAGVRRYRGIGVPSGSWMRQRPPSRAGRRPLIVAGPALLDHLNSPRLTPSVNACH